MPVDDEWFKEALHHLGAVASYEDDDITGPWPAAWAFLQEFGITRDDGIHYLDEQGNCVTCGMQFVGTVVAD